MRVKLLLAAIACVQSFQHVQSNIVENMAAHDGYYTESHSVTTEDGYILEVNRIPYARFRNQNNTKNTDRPVVFLMHGLLASATSFILIGPEASIAYNLADVGYDVWIGNARGVLNSRNHIDLNPNNPEDRNKFFDYSFHEIGFYDISAMVDYILEKTGQKQLHYIGHSQGGTAFLVHTSTRPEYNRKYKSVHLLAGVGYQEHFPSKFLGSTAKGTNLIYRVANELGYVEVLRPRNFANLEKDINCLGEAVEVCDLQHALEVLDNYIDPMRQVHGSAAMKQIAHFGQNVNDKIFRRWNFGPFRNALIYGQLTPPVYDLSLISADVTMHYTVSDRLLDERDVLSMANVMPNTRVRKVADESFLHSGFMFDRNVKHLVTDYIIEQINQH